MPVPTDVQREADRRESRDKAKDQAEAGLRPSSPETERDAEHSFTSGPKRDPAAPGASNNGDLGRRMFAGETPAGADADNRTERQKHEEWPTKGIRPGSENLSGEEIPQGLPLAEAGGEPVREGKVGDKKTS